MEHIRSHIQNFVDVHNTHKIRHQKNRDYLPTGKPVEMFKYPPTGVKNYAENPDIDLLTELQDQVASWDHEAYQSEETAQLCVKILTEAGMPMQWETISYDDESHWNAYLLLREKLREHVKNGGELTTIPKPEGGRKWINEQKQKESEHLQQEIDEVRRVEADEDETFLSTEEIQENDEEWDTDTDMKMDTNEDNDNDGNDDGLIIDLQAEIRL